MKEILSRLPKVKGDFKKHLDRLKGLIQKKPLLAGGAVLLFLLLVNLIGIHGGNEGRLMERPAEVSFQQGRILNDRESSFYYGKERLLSQKAQAMIDGTAKLEARIAELEKKNQGTDAKAKPGDTGPPTATGGTVGPTTPPPVSVASGAGPGTTIDLYPAVVSLVGGRVRSGGKGRGGVAGRDLIAFPVKGEPKVEGVVLPAGSYVKAKVLTGVDVPEGKTYPALLVLDFSYVAPNDHKVDLSGCFMIAKAEGDLSTERVQMQATKMSCVSRAGKMFEREVNGFIADDRDGSFAVGGTVNSKQGRVAAMAFMASVVDGVGKAVQAAQTTQSVNPLGGSSSILTGDSTKYMVAGGASNAAGMVAQWYLQQAQSLSPTVSVGQGRDVWIVMKDKVSLPDDFFKKERKANEGISYFSRVLD